MHVFSCLLIIFLDNDFHLVSSYVDNAYLIYKYEGTFRRFALCGACYIIFDTWHEIYSLSPQSTSLHNRATVLCSTVLPISSLCTTSKILETTSRLIVDKYEKRTCFLEQFHLHFFAWFNCVEAYYDFLMIHVLT